MTSQFAEDDWKMALRPRFLELTAERLLELQNEMSALTSGADPAGALCRIRAVAHKISGTAETFSCANLGALARQVEDVCQPHILAANSPQATRILPNALASIEALIVEMKVVVRQR